MLGEFPLSMGCTWDKKTGTLTASVMMHNPAMFVPDLKTIVWGCGSFWNRITSEEQLRQITDSDIGDVWYIKALLRGGVLQGASADATPQADNGVRVGKQK
jgi:hypothetical protein